MTEEQKDDLVVKWTKEAWAAWAREGLDVVERELGPVKEEPWILVFRAGWELGFAHALNLGREGARERAQKVPSPN